MTTLKTLLADHPAEALAIGAPDRDWLTYGGLRSLAADVAAQLHSVGVGRGDRVAIVLPNGPEMATAFVTIAQAATTGAGGGPCQRPVGVARAGRSGRACRAVRAESRCAEWRIS